VEISVPGEGIDKAETFGAELRRVRRSRGVSLRDLGLLVHYSKGHLSKLENNVTPASLDLAEACDSVLRADGRLTAAFLADLSRLMPASGTGALVSGTAQPAVPFDIPPPPSHFVGREAETAHVIEAIFATRDLCRAPVVLVHGRPGIGKTALAAQVAHTARTRYPGGCLFVDFGSLEDGAPLHARLLRRLGVPLEDIPDEPTEARALYLSVLYRRHVLIVADGVTSSAQVTELVPASPGCAVLATSRRRLHALDDCLPILLPPLRPADAVTLFRQVSGLPELAREEDLRRVAAACDHLPLAVRVAAAKARQSGHDVGELAELLEDPATAWPELDDGERSVLRTLREEYDALPDGGRHMLAMLALHPEETVAPQQVAWMTGGPPRAVAADFGVLRRHDLVTVGPDRRAVAHGLVRRLAVTIADQLDDGVRAESMRRLVAGYPRTATAADTVITRSRYQPPGGDDQKAASSGDLAAALAWCRAEAAQLPRLYSLALELGRYADCWRLAYAMRDYFFTVKASAPWIASHHVALLAAERGGDLWAQAATRNNLGMAYAGQHQQALMLMRTLGDSQGLHQQAALLFTAFDSAGGMLSDAEDDQPR
jgi:transcriptional regulator with XRE-family HTH domain